MDPRTGLRPIRQKKTVACKSAQMQQRLARRELRRMHPPGGLRSRQVRQRAQHLRVRGQLAGAPLRPADLLVSCRSCRRQFFKKKVGVKFSTHWI
jgi:hypothetical protein